MGPVNESASTGSPERPSVGRGAHAGAHSSAGGTDPADTPERQARREGWQGLDQGSIMSVELLTATLVWFGIGWLVDRWLGTMPWFMFAGALLGNWAGLYLIWVRGQRSEIEEKRRAATRTATAGHPATDTEAKKDTIR